MELESKWCTFTWMNNREGDELVKERLDRIMCSMDWRLIYPVAEVLALPALGSDHCPLLLNTTTKFRKWKKTFIYEAFWNQDQQCKEIIYNSWNSTRVSNPNLLHKLKAVSTDLANWSRSKFQNGHLRVLHLQNQLQLIINSPHNNSNDRVVASTLRDEIRRIWQEEEQF